MSKKSVENLFKALYNLTDLRKILRETSPQHNLNAEQEKELEKLISETKANLAKIEEEMVK